MMLNPGDNVLNFEVFAFCGSGAFGEVYAVRDAQNRHYALKVIPKQRLDREDRELRALARYQEIAHGCSALLRIHQVRETANTLYIIMDLADNRAPSPEYRPDTLDARLENGQTMPFFDLRIMVSELISGLRQLHLCGMAHRDLKPNNIVFVNGCAKISDLGLLLSDTSLTCHVAGTLDFIAPEHRTGQVIFSGQICMSDDIYALGKVIYCALTANPAYLYPSIPDSVPITLELRLWNQFIGQLCSPRPEERIRELSPLLSCWQQTEYQLYGGDVPRRTPFPFFHTFKRFTLDYAFYRMLGVFLFRALIVLALFLLILSLWPNSDAPLLAF